MNTDPTDSNPPSPVPPVCEHFMIRVDKAAGLVTCSKCGKEFEMFTGQPFHFPKHVLPSGAALFHRTDLPLQPKATPVSATPPAQPAVVPERCKCFTEVENKLKERGLQVSDSCQALGVASLTLTFSIGFPLQRIDHKKLKHGEPKFLAFSHCPFCGKPYPKDE